MNTPDTYRPFLVADRPASLRMIRGANLEAFDTPCGIMTHANVSQNVQEFVRDFPSSAGFYTSETENPRKKEYDDESNYWTAKDGLTQKGKRIRDRTVRICDSGAFNKEGSNFDSYENLYELYDYMAVDFGIIIDELNNKEATLKAADQAMSVYTEADYNFQLVGVAQGTDKKEYLDCYDELRELGYNHIAVGGLLETTGERSGAFAHVNKEKYMEEILRAIRSEYPQDWLFALGCHHPRRREFFQDLGLFGSDYKGWIYKYSSRNGRGEVEARNWRYRNIRSFIRNNILSGSWISPKEDLDISDQKPTRLLIVDELPGQVSDSGRLPPIERFSSKPFRKLQSWRESNNNSKDVDILTFRSKYGLIPADFQIPLKEDINKYPDKSFHEALRIDLRKFLKYREYDEILILGADTFQYLTSTTLKQIVEDKTTIKQAEGSVDDQVEALENWLSSESSQKKRTSLAEFIE